MLVSEDELSVALGVPVVFARHILDRVRALQRRETPPDWDGATLLRARIAHAATHPEDTPLLLEGASEPTQTTSQKLDAETFDRVVRSHSARSPMRMFGRKGL